MSMPSIFASDDDYIPGSVLGQYTSALSAGSMPRRVPAAGPEVEEDQESEIERIIRERLEAVRPDTSDTSGSSGSSRYELGPDFAPPARQVFRQQGPGFMPTLETGSRRVNEFNMYENDDQGMPLGRYNVEEDWKSVLYSMDFRDRQSLFTKLFNRGVYHGRKPSTFFVDPYSEGEVVKRLLHVANVEGRTFSWVVKTIVEQVPEKPGKNKSGISEAQAINLVQSAAQQMIGRNLRPKELTPAVAGLRGNLGSMPPSDAARKAVGGQATDEQMAYGVSKYASLMARALR